MNIDVHDFCSANKIVYYVLPAHASHIVQPLDLVFYGQLKAEWKKAVRDFKVIHNAATVTKHTFSQVFKDAWQRAYTRDRVIGSFEASGLSPWNPERPDYSKCSSSLAFGKSTGNVLDQTVVEESVLSTALST